MVWYTEIYHLYITQQYSWQTFHYYRRSLNFICTTARNLWFPCGIQMNLNQCTNDTWCNLRRDSIYCCRSGESSMVVKLGWYPTKNFHTDGPTIQSTAHIQLPTIKLTTFQFILPYSLILRALKVPKGPNGIFPSHTKSCMSLGTSAPAAPVKIYKNIQKYKTKKNPLAFNPVPSYTCNFLFLFLKHGRCFLTNWLDSVK